MKQTLANILSRIFFSSDSNKQEDAAVAICKAIIDKDNVTSIALIHECPNCVNTPTGPEGYTPFLMACLHGNTQVAKVMLKFGADVNQVSASNESAFYLATFCNVKNMNDRNASCLHMLYYAGADIDTPTNRNITSLQLAAMFGKTNLVRWLLLKGANVSVVPHPYILARSQGFQSTADAILEWEREKLAIPAIQEI